MFSIVPCYCILQNILFQPYLHLHLLIVSLLLAYVIHYLVIYFSYRYVFHFSFPGMRSSLDCLFVSSRPMLFIVSTLHFAWFVSGSRSFICCYLVADVIHCTVLLPGFFAISISLRGLPVFSLSIGFVPRYRRFIALLYIFSKAATLLQFSRHEKFFGLFVCFLMTDVIYCIPIAFCLLCLFPHDRCYLLYSHCILLALFPARDVFFVVAS